MRILLLIHSPNDLNHLVDALIFEKVDFVKNIRRQQKQAILPSMERAKQDLKLFHRKS